MSVLPLNTVGGKDNHGTISQHMDDKDLILYNLIGFHVENIMCVESGCSKGNWKSFIARRLLQMNGQG